MALHRNSSRGKISHEIIWVGKGWLYGKKRRSGVMPLSVAAFGGTELRINAAITSENL